MQQHKAHGGPLERVADLAEILIALALTAAPFVIQHMQVAA